VLVILLALSGCGSGPAAHGSGPAAHGSGPAARGTAAVVPWKPLAPTYPKIPERIVPARPDPAAAEAAPPCRAGDLRTDAHVEGVSGGTMMLVVEARPRTEPGCRLEGRVTATLLDRERPLDVPLVLARPGSGWFGPWLPVLATRRHPAVLSILWWGNWCIAPVTNDRVLLTLSRGRGTITVPGFGHSPPCEVRLTDLKPDQRHPSTVVVGRFEPQDYRPARRRSDYAAVRAGAGRTTTARPGEPLEFTVTLTATRDVVLDPCPDYTILHALGDGASSEDRYALNCADVPSKDAQGRPYLPAGQPVTFAMRTRMLRSTADLKFLWELQVPDRGGEGVGIGVGP
jgi:hypothetical protein